MTIRRQITTFSDPETQRSDFTWLLGDTRRTLLFVGGRVTMPAIESPITLQLEDFEWLTTEVRRWIVTISGVMELPVISASPVYIDFLVDTNLSPPASRAPRYTAGVVVRVKMFGASYATIEAQHSRDIVTLAPRPSYDLAWADVVLVNNLWRELAYVAINGKRPPIGWE